MPDRNNPEHRVWTTSIDIDRYDSSIQYMLLCFQVPELATIESLRFYRRQLDQINVLTLKVFLTNGRSQENWDKLTTKDTTGISFTTAAELFGVVYSKDKPYLEIPILIDEITDKDQKGNRVPKSLEEIKEIITQKLPPELQEKAKSSSWLRNLFSFAK